MELKSQGYLPAAGTAIALAPTEIGYRNLVRGVHAVSQAACFVAQGLARWFFPDIRSREQARALRTAEARYRSIFENALEGIFQTTPDGTYIDVNPALARIYGYDSVLELRAGLRDITRQLYVQPGRRDEFIRRLEERDSLSGFESEVYRKDGARIWIAENARAIRDSDGRLLYYEGTVQDISERKQTEALCQAAVEAEAAANRAKSEFLANMSHEIRTPMTAILGYVDLLSQESESPEFRRQALDIIRRNGEHLLQLINDILDLSKIDADKPIVDLRDCDLPALLHEVTTLMQVRARAKGLRLTCELAGPVPRTIRTDDGRLRQVLLNLVGNALKFTVEGHVLIRCGTTPLSGDAPASLWIDVIDSGVGIAPDRLEHIFLPFCQADTSTTREFGGTGLGLTISQRLAQALGGRIEVESRLGEGSRFRMTIACGRVEGVPLVERLAAEPARVACDLAPIVPTESLHGRVLLAEDGDDNMRLISLLLKKLGVDVVAVMNGRDAVDVALAAEQSSTPFDLVLLDMQMPVLDGYGAAAELRSQGYSRPIVALTAHAMSHDAGKCLACGCDDYATKPINRNRLREVLVKHLRPQTACTAK